MDGADPGDWTGDTFFHGRLKVRQPRRGYRFSLDAPMLAGFLPARPAADALEVGAGCGIVSLMGLALGRFRRVRAVELQARLCGLARENARLNGFSDRMEVICGDFLKLGKEFSSLELVFANPPFHPLGRGRLSRDREVRDACFETRLPLGDFLLTAAGVLAPRGGLCLVFPARREGELLETAAGCGLFPSRLRRVHSFAHDKAGRFLVQLGFFRGDPVIHPPLVVFRSPGEYTPEMESLLSGRAHDPKTERTD